MNWLSNWCKSERRLDGFTTIVTGANTGIGRETAYDFYKRGARVIMACRNIEKAEAAKKEMENRTESNGNGILVVEKLDLCSLKSVRDFANKILASEKSLEILVNNAGVMCVPEGRTEDGFETHIGSNYFAHALLTLLLLPKLMSSAPSRIVFVSSDAHYFHRLDLDDMNFDKIPYGPMEAYVKSKAAAVMFIRALSQKLKEHKINGVTTYSVHPGIVRTSIDRHVARTWWFWMTFGFHSQLLNWLWKTPECGAQTIIYCAVDENCANECGLYYSDCAPKLPSSYCLRDSDVQKLWEITLKDIGLQEQNIFQKQ